MLQAGISLDETVTVYVANSVDLKELLARIVGFEYSPPLYFLLMQYWIRAFGDAPYTVAIPSTIFGVLLIPASFVFGKVMLKDGTRALLVAFFAGVSSLAIFYSHEVRTY